MAQIYISVGSNVDKEQHIRSAIKALQTIFSQLTISSVYESEPVGFVGENFFNLVVGAQSRLSIKDTVAALKQIEREHGRELGQEKFSDRTLDLDLLLYDDVVTSDGVVLPRDEIDKNAFVLWPMAEIAPALHHPIQQKSYAQLWQEYDKSKQKLWTITFAF